jgi:hypothetical protein
MRLNIMNSKLEDNEFINNNEIKQLLEAYSYKTTSNELQSL